jgi:hypothetical protein
MSSKDNYNDIYLFIYLINKLQHPNSILQNKYLATNATEPFFFFCQFTNNYGNSSKYLHIYFK